MPADLSGLDPEFTEFTPLKSLTGKEDLDGLDGT